MTLNEAMRIAELQAESLLRLTRVDCPPISEDIVLTRRIKVSYDFDMPASLSGASAWVAADRCWIITINGKQPRTRQRFTVLHEYKHVIDDGHAGLDVDPRRRIYGLPPAEFLADYFAGCVLMPRRQLTQSWSIRGSNHALMAAQFDVSERALEVRLAQLRLGPTSKTHQLRNQPGREGLAA